MYLLLLTVNQINVSLPPGVSLLQTRYTVRTLSLCSKKIDSITPQPLTIYGTCKVKFQTRCPAPCRCARSIALPESAATSRAPSPAPSETESIALPPDFDTDMLDSEQGAQGHH